MASETEYAAVATVLRKIIEADINSEVPEFLRGDIPDSVVDKFAVQMAHAAADALDRMRGAK